MTDAIQAAAEHLARRYDDVIERALTQALGREDWTPEEIAPRVHLTASPGGDTFTLDGVPLVWIGPLKLQQKGGHIMAEREWRMLR